MNMETRPNAQMPAGKTRRTLHAEREDWKLFESRVFICYGYALRLYCVSCQEIILSPISTLWPLYGYRASPLRPFTRRARSQMNILMAQNRFKGVLERMARSSVSSIESQSIAGQKTTYDRGDRHRSRFKKDVYWAPDQYMMQGVGSIYSGFPMHYPRLSLHTLLST